MKKIAVLMGSDSDLPVVKAAFVLFREYPLPGQNIWQAMRKKSGDGWGELNLPCLHIRRRIWLLIMKIHPVLTVQPGPSGLPQNKEIEQMEE